MGSGARGRPSPRPSTSTREKGEGMRQPTYAQRRREAVARLGLTWVGAVGWADGPLLMISAASHEWTDRIGKERKRVEIMAAREGAALQVSACYAGSDVAASVRRRLREMMATTRVGAEMFSVDKTSFKLALGETGARALGEAEIMDMVERAMMEGV